MFHRYNTKESKFDLAIISSSIFNANSITTSTLVSTCMAVMVVPDKIPVFTPNMTLEEAQHVSKARSYSTLTKYISS